MNVNGHAARTQPSVPPMRTRPNSFCESFMLANAMELTMERVGTYSRQCTSISPKNGQKVFVNARPSIASPPTQWLNARNFSAAKLRSQNWLLKNMPTMAAMGNALRIHDCSAGENPRLGR